jgi:hypothetical protein
MNKFFSNCLKSFAIVASVLVISTFLAPKAHAQTFVGSNSSSEKIVLSINPNGTAEIAWYPVKSTNSATREVWLVSAEANGFRLTTPATSRLKKPGDAIIYSRISNKSTTMHCTSGCASTMPNLIGLSQ